MGHPGAHERSWDPLTKLQYAPEGPKMVSGHLENSFSKRGRLEAEVEKMDRPPYLLATTTTSLKFWLGLLLDWRSHEKKAI